MTILTYIKNLLGKKGHKKPERNEAHFNDQKKGAHSLRSKKSPKAEKQAPHYNKHIIKATQVGITPRMISKNALTVVEKLNRHGYEAYVVGGCLRDLLLGKNPKDFDVATNARPEQIQAIFQRQCRLVGRRFRLAHIMFGRDVIEVATFRASHAESKNENHARQSEEGMLLRDNVFGTLEQDAERRDFTVNALYYSPKDNCIHDYFNGIDDLKAGKLRLIGDPVTRYQEDPVRMLRSIRFMAKLDMFLEKPSAQPIRDLAPLLKNIPPARLFDESLKLLQAGFGVKTYQLLREYGLFEQLFPTLVPFFTEKGDSFAERMILTALRSTDERVADKLRLNPAFLFAAFYWYPLREKVEILKNEGGLTSVDLLCTGKDDLASLAKLPVGKYNIHYTAIPNDIEYDGNRPERESDYKFTRKTMTLTVAERTFPSDFKLNGIVGDKLANVALPEGWSWVDPETKITGTADEYDVKYVNGEYSKTVKVVVNAVVVDKEGLKARLAEATAEAAKIDVYKAATIEKLNTVIEEATKVLNDTSANKEAVEEAIRALNTAIANLEKYVTEAELDQVIAKGEEFLGKTDIYTKESLDILSTALAKVRSAITSGDKEAIESAYAQLTEAIDKLVKIDAPTPEVKPEVKPENKPNTSVKTGDNTYLGAIMTSLLLSAGGLVLFKKRKYN